MKKCSSWCHNKNLGLLLLRIAVGVTFLVHGIGKLSNMTGTIAFFDQIGFGPFWAWVTALVETIAGAAVILGLWSCLSGGLLAIIMLVVIIGVKWGNPFTGGPGAYELDFVLLFASLALASMGGGKFALTGRCCKGNSQGCVCNKEGCSTCSTDTPATPTP